MHTFATPMMRQYMDIKKDYPDCLLFFRMGDFYELFMEDAHVGSRILNITLTGKAGGKDGKIPMAGVPYHAADSYITKLVKAGLKVAICEQLSPPNKKGLVKRGVVRIVTPGTLLASQGLDNKTNNFIISLTISETSYELAIADLSTGYFALKESVTADIWGGIVNDIAEIRPTECILPEELYNDQTILTVLNRQKEMNIFSSPLFPTHKEDAEKILKKHFNVSTLAGFGVEMHTNAYIPGAALLGYLKETQNGTLPHLKKIVLYDLSDGLKLDRSTIANLELFATIREHDTSGSLLAVLDQTTTAMGGRMLKMWMKQPLADKAMIEARLEAVSSSSTDSVLRDSLREELKQLPDIERLLTRLSVQLGNVRDITQLKQALRTVLAIRVLLQSSSSSLLKELSEKIEPTLQNMIERITDVFVDEPPLSVREGNFINKGVDTKLDAMKNSILMSKNWIQDLEKNEKARTGISSLRVTFNKVFGFSIEVSKANAKLVPEYYVRKQTLVNAERYITDELKHHEDIILTAEEKINAIEYKIYLDFLEELSLYTDSVQAAAASISAVDVLTNFSVISDKNRFVKPKLVYSGELRIKDGRHPVVEQVVTDVPFVPNDTILDNVSQSLLIITGPNMAGKSVYIRQVALIVLLAHIGCFVPASAAHISVVDRIFVRSGASDFITSGLSTFMVEMVETAAILHNATSQSLIIMDEIGRGTSTYDGISIAWSVAEHLVTRHTPPPKVLFATHYHELQALETEYPGKIKNYHMAVTEQDGDPVFLHSLLPGGASHSFGISVAKLAGVPDEVLKKAHAMLATLEARQTPGSLLPQETEYRHSQFIERLILRELESVDIGTMTPLGALNILASLKEKYSLLLHEQTATTEKD